MIRYVYKHTQGTHVKQMRWEPRFWSALNHEHYTIVNSHLHKKVTFLVVDRGARSQIKTFGSLCTWECVVPCVCAYSIELFNNNYIPSLYAFSMFFFSSKFKFSVQLNVVMFTSYNLSYSPLLRQKAYNNNNNKY